VGETRGGRKWKDRGWGRKKMNALLKKTRKWEKGWGSLTISVC